MRKFLSILLVIALTMCLSSAVLAVTETNPHDEDNGMTWWKGQYVPTSTLTVDEIEEALGIKAVRERAAAMAALDASASALVIPGIENLYGDAMDRSFKKNRNNFLSDTAAIIQLYGVNPNMDDPRDYAPRPYFADIFNYYKEAWLALGFEENGIESRCYVSRLPNANVPVQKQGKNGESENPLLMVMEMGAKSLPEVTINFCHQDTTNEDLTSYGVGGNHGGWPGSAPRGVWDILPNRFWTLGGARQANIVKDPGTDRYTMVGRGTDDDRAPAVAMLYAMKALKEAGVPLRRRVRLLIGQNEESSARWAVTGIVNRASNQSFWDGQYYVHQDEFPIMGTTADSGVTEIMYQPSTSTWNPVVRLSWTDNPNTGIGLRFPNVLDYTALYYTGLQTAAMTYGTSTNLTPAALPNILYNQAREEFVYKSYYAGDKMSTQNGQNLRLAAWLVMPNGQNASEIVAAARTVRDNFRVNWGGWEWPDEKDRRPQVMRVLASDRWDTGIYVEQVDSRTGNLSSTGDAVQVITKGYVSRFWEKEFFSPRHIMIDFLSKIVIPNGWTAGWQSEMRKAITFFPLDNLRERKIWNGHTMMGNYMPPIYSGIYAYVGGFTPNFTTPLASDSSIIANGGHTSWTPKYGTSTAYASQGRNDENITRIDVQYNMTYGHVPVPDGYLNPATNAAAISTAVRQRCQDLGLTITSPAGAAANSTGSPYSAWDQDILKKAERAYNAYYRKFGVLDPGYSGAIKEVRADVIAGGTYAIDFRIAPNPTSPYGFDGRMIATGGWGGRGSLHSYNERIELDGLVDHGKRTARLFAEYAAGVPHTWTVAGAAERTDLNWSGGGYKGFSEKRKLQYASSNDVVYGVYLEEESVAKPIITRLYNTGKIPASVNTEILFARKFKMADLNTTPRGLTLTTTLTNPNGTNLGGGTVYLFAKQTDSPDPINATWTEVGTKSSGSTTFLFADGGPYDHASDADTVEVSVIALVVTNGSSVVALDTSSSEITEESTTESSSDDKTGCNAGFAALAFMFIPFVVRRRK